MKKKQPTHGGARPGAGRKPKAPTTTITFRVRTDIAEQFREAANRIKKRLERTKPN